MSGKILHDRGIAFIAVYARNRHIVQHAPPVLRFRVIRIVRQQILHDIDEVRAVVKETVLAGRFVFFTVDAKAGAEFRAHALNSTDFFYVGFCRRVIVGKAPLVVYEHGHAAFFRFVRDRKSVFHAQRDGLFQNQ